MVASDSVATFGSTGVPTIGQQEVSKLHRLTDSVLFSSTGAVGMAQLVANEVKKGWEKDEFKNIRAPEEAMNLIGTKIASTLHPYLQTANLSRPLVGDCSASLCKSLVAMPVRRVPCLFNFDYNGAPERSTTDLPFIALGSGQPNADPFLVYCHNDIFTIRAGYGTVRFMWKPADVLPMTAEQKRTLEAWVRAGTTPQRIVLRSRICLLAAEGKSNNAIADQLGTSRPTVLLWRKRFRKQALRVCLRTPPMA